MFKCLPVCNGLCWDNFCSYGYLWSWKYLSFTNYSLRSGIPVPQEHLEIKDCKIRENGAFLCWIIDAAKRTQILKHSCAELLKSCSYRTILRARHNVAVTRIVTLTPMQQIVFFVFIHFAIGSCVVDHKDVLTLRGKWQRHSDRRWSARSWRSPLRTHGTSCPRNRQRSQTWNKLSLKSENFGF